MAALGTAAYYAYGKKRKKTIVVVPSEQLGSEMPVSEKRKYSPALLREYDLIVPPFKATKKAQKVAQEITQKRFTIDSTKVKNPLYL